MANKIRRYDMDWLRNSAMLLVILYHTGMIFAASIPYFIKNTRTSAAITYYLIGFLDIWLMPLFFVLAGGSTWFALRTRTIKAYAEERLKRLGIPFVFGLFAIMPWLSYYAWLSHRSTPDSYFVFYPHFFEMPNGDLSGYTGGFTLSQLWFIMFLIVFSLATLPLFRYWRDHPRFIERTAAFCAVPGCIYLLALPIADSGLLPEFGGKNPFYYGTLFIAGYLLMADERFQTAIDKQKWRSLALGIVAMAISIGSSVANISFAKYSPGDITLYLVRVFDMWFWVLALLGLGHTYLNFKHRWLPYFTEAAYPVYLLHQSIVVAVGFYLINSSWSVAAKYIGIVALSLPIIWLLYEIAVRRINALRFLFGMKPKPPMRAMPIKALEIAKLRPLEKR